MNRKELKQKMKDADDKWKRLNIPIHMDVKIEDFLEIFEEYEKEIAALKAKLESVQATAYADSMDAGMRERRLRKALYKACANWANVEVFDRTVGIDDPNVEANRWALMRNKCLKKAEEYK